MLLNIVDLVNKLLFREVVVVVYSRYLELYTVEREEYKVRERNIENKGLDTSRELYVESEYKRQYEGYGLGRAKRLRIT